MMRSRLDFTLDEADNADNLLLWEQEVFSWADSQIHYRLPGDGMSEECPLESCMKSRAGVYVVPHLQILNWGHGVEGED